MGTRTEHRRGMGKVVAFGQVERNVVGGEDGAELGFKVGAESAVIEEVTSSIYAYIESANGRGAEVTFNNCTY